MKRLIGYFLKGLLVFVPAAITVLIIFWAIKEFDSLLGSPIPGLGFIAALAFITLIGFLASNYIGNKLFLLLDKLFTRLPVIKMFYAAIRDLIQAFAGERKSFDKPVIVELTTGGPKAIGFITQEDLGFLSMPGNVAVYFPQSYNFAGSVLIFPAERVAPMNIESSKAMTFVVSGGVSGK
ncbi:MAG: hypothetical protein A2Y10_08185 [Planctomycetes bacterium GWF2_41_51]|nr:MAG: hypothetical protein A2Y10_08185 [Planctomycetes bacterium GWF2_41_51]HBG26138.1 hypothetical protein [Phycisphaerales bacterium]